MNQEISGDNLKVDKLSNLWIMYLLFSLTLMVPFEVRSQETNGPKIDYLLIKFYDGPDEVINALLTNEIDMIDWCLSYDQVNEIKNNPDLNLMSFGSTGIFQIDINNNETTPSFSDWPNPTYYKEFRQALAYLVDKERIITEILLGNACRIDSPIPPSTLSDYINYEIWYPNYPYEYNITKACEILYNAGWKDAPTPESPVHWPPDHPLAGQLLNETLGAGLIFYIRSDDPIRQQIGNMIADQLEAVGIPVDRRYETPSNVFYAVMRDRDYHLYTGAWRVDNDPGFMRVFHSSQISPIGSFAPNYPQFRNSSYDYWCERVIHAANLSELKQGMLQCQRILVENAVCVWLYEPLYYQAYRKEWTNVYAVPDYGIINRWTMLQVQNVDPQKNTLRIGTAQPPTRLNIITSMYPWEHHCLERIYDSLLYIHPFNTTILMPWLAESWEIGFWENPFNPDYFMSTKLTFHLRSDVQWHDGIPFNSSDVEFTINYIKQHKDNAWNYPLVEEVHHVTTPDPYTVEIYMNTTNYLALQYIGSLPIIPKHIFQNIQDPSGEWPGQNEGYTIDQVLVGTGPFKFVEYVPGLGGQLLLEANRDYFTPTLELHDVAVIDVSPSYTTVQKGGILPINVTVINYGDYPETFNVTLYCNETLIGTQTVYDLLNKTSKTLIFNWNTSNFPTGIYQLKAIAAAVPEEIDLSNNEFIDGTIQLLPIQPQPGTLPIISVYPQEVRRTLGVSFEVNITIENVTDLYAFDIKLYYNTTLLQVVKLKEGSFLKSHGETFTLNETNLVEGYVRFVTTLLGEIPGVNGTGTLFSVTFVTAINVTGISPLLLGFTELSTPKVEHISHLTRNGTVNVVEVDVKEHIVTVNETEYTIVTLSNSTVAPDEELTFNEEEKIISFNITGPTGTTGFCNMTVPKAIMNGTFAILVNGTAIPYTRTENQTHYFLHFTYSHSTEQIQILLTIPGDINGDRTVNLLDLVVIAIAYDSVPSDPNWNPLADIHKDNKITLLDLVAVAIQYGKTWTP